MTNGASRTKHSFDPETGRSYSCLMMQAAALFFYSSLLKAFDIMARCARH